MRAADVDILRLCVAEIVKVEGAVGIQLLGVFHADGVALLAGWREGYPASHVLVEVVDSSG